MSEQVDIFGRGLRVRGGVGRSRVAAGGRGAGMGLRSRGVRRTGVVRPRPSGQAGLAPYPDPWYDYEPGVVMSAPAGPAITEDWLEAIAEQAAGPPVYGGSFARREARAVTERKAEIAKRRADERRWAERANRQRLRLAEQDARWKAFEDHLAGRDYQDADPRELLNIFGPADEAFGATHYGAPPEDETNDLDMPLALGAAPLMSTSVAVITPPEEEGWASSRTSTFGDAVKVGAGVTLGVGGMLAGLSLLSRLFR